MNNNKNYLGIDWGTERIGLALGNSGIGVATPFRTVQNLSQIIEIIRTEEIEAIVVGRPISLANHEHQISDGFEKFVNDLRSATDVSVELADERLSSKAADALTGGHKGEKGRDEVAAMVILQSYFDKTGNN